MNIFLIAAVDSKWGMGKDGELLFKLRQDMMFFAEKTKNAVVVLGRKTFESLPPRGLVGRHHIIVSNSPVNEINFPSQFNERYTVVKDMGTAIRAATRAAKEMGLDDVAICGGSWVYSEALPFCDKAYLTRIHARKDADVFFPAYRFYQFFPPELASAGQLMFENGVEFQFCTHKKTIAEQKAA